MRLIVTELRKLSPRSGVVSAYVLSTPEVERINELPLGSIDIIRPLAPVIRLENPSVDPSRAGSATKPSQYPLSFLQNQGLECEVYQINPLLTPPPYDPTERPYLSWNMLFSASYVHRSDEPQRQSWMSGRDEPATNPRLSFLHIISRRFPWFIDVKAREPTLGVTCGEIIDMVAHFLHERMGEREYKSLPMAGQRRINGAYHYNRSMADDVPGGRLGQGIRRCEILGSDTMWGGLVMDQREMTGIFVMECERRLPRTADVWMG